VKKQRIYLETSLFNFYVDDSKGVSHDNTVRLFEEIAAGKYEAFTSAFVVGELKDAQEEKRKKMLALIPKYRISMLAESNEASYMADIYVAEGVIPQKYRMDGIHIALAAINEMDMIVSMNFRHIVKQKTIRMTESINIINGYRAVRIYSPAEVIEHGKEDRFD